MKMFLLSCIIFLSYFIVSYGICSSCVPVFYSGLNNSNCYRIPTIIKTRKGTLLAFAENRKTNCGDNGKSHDLVLRRSFDNGKTWGTLILVVKGTIPCPGCPAAISNPNPVEIIFSNTNKSSILLHYDTMNNPNTLKHGLDMQIWSDNEGLTWYSSSILSYPPQKNIGALIGPSVGIQNPKSAFINGLHFLYFSKDYGKSWLSSKSIPSLGECSIAFLPHNNNGDILMNCRTGKNQRAQVIWSADGVAKTNITYPIGMIDSRCQGSIITASNGNIYLSNTNTTSSRTHMTIKKSIDNGITWNNGKLIWDKGSAYSQLVDLRDNTIGLLFECGESSPYETISFTTTSYD